MNPQTPSSHAPKGKGAPTAEEQSLLGGKGDPAEGARDVAPDDDRKASDAGRRAGRPAQ